METEKLLRDHSCKIDFWAQLFEGRLALNPGLNLTRVSISFVQKHFLGQFSLLFLRASNHQLVNKTIKLSYFLSFHF